MEKQAANAPVCLGVTACCAGQHNVKHQEVSRMPSIPMNFSRGAAETKLSSFFLAVWIKEASITPMQRKLLMLVK